VKQTTPTKGIDVQKLGKFPGLFELVMVQPGAVQHCLILRRRDSTNPKNEVAQFKKPKSH
jgi:hypothetical protein